jgi:formate C-acetyltransferase
MYRQKEPKIFYEASQSFRFVQLLIQMASSGHSIHRDGFDQYMFPYNQKIF